MAAVFGFLRPCRHHLTPELHALWSAHLCGLCTTLRDEAGHLARATTHVDALVVSVLAQAQGVGEQRREGPCPLRGMRPASVVGGDGARLAASTSLLLAADAVDDHVQDRDGAFRSHAGAVVGGRVATRWSRAGARTAAQVAFDPTDLLAVPARQREVEAALGGGTASVVGRPSGPTGVPDASAPRPRRPGVGSVADDDGPGGRADVLDRVTAPTAEAVGSALAHTAVLAGRPGNAAPLSEAGRLLGRLAHLLDAVADREEDRAGGRWNPLEATGTSSADALDRCRRAVSGIRRALRRVRHDPAQRAARELAHVLLVHETGRAVERVAAEVGLPTVRSAATCAPDAHDPDRPGPRRAVAHEPWDPARPPGGPVTRPDPDAEPDPDEPDEPDDPDETADPGGPDAAPPAGPGGSGGRPWGPRRGLLGGCAAAAGLCCTGQLCCADEFTGPWSGRPRQGWCGDACDAVSCSCDCCDCCGEGCDCCDGDCCSCDCG